MSVNKHFLQHLLTQSLMEDCPETDITSTFFLPDNPIVRATVVAKAPGVFYGHEIVRCLCSTIVEGITLTKIVENGSVLSARDVVCYLEGPIRSILYIERVLLNFLQRLSGISTTTAAFVKQLNNPSIKVLDTRKTTPTFRP